MDLRKLKDKATEAFTKGKFAKAAEAYEEYCAADPKDHQARLRMGDAWAKAGKKDKAIGAYTKAAEGFAKDGFLPRAIAASKLILELDPSHSGVQKMLAGLYARKSGPAMPASKPAGATATGVEQKVPGSTTDAAFANRKDAIALDAPPAPAAKPKPAAPKPGDAPSPMNRADAIELPEYEIPMETVSAGSSAVPVAAKGPSPQRNARAIEFDEGPAGPTGPAALENTTIDLGVRVPPTAAGATPAAPAEPVEPAGIAIEVETSAGEDSQLPIVGVEVSLDPPAPPPPPQFLGDAATPQFAGDPMTPQPSGPDVPIIIDPEPISEPVVAAIPPPNPSGPDLPISVDLRAVPPPAPRPSVPDVILEGEPISDPAVAAVPPPPPPPSMPEIVEAEPISHPVVAAVPPPPPSMPEIVEAEPISDPAVAAVPPPPPPPSLPPQAAVPVPRPSVPDLTQDAQLIEEPAPPRPSGPEITFEENPPQPPPLPPHRPELQVITESPTVVVSPLATQTDEEIVRSGEGAAPPGLRPKPKGPELPPPAAPRIYIPQPGGTTTVEDVVLSAPVTPAPSGSTDLERSLEIFSHFETEDFLPPARAAAAAALAP
ncbi:MAG: tetratricopeptide repeat protein, partial [Myxococcaceae bacterium]|nr:tetratricopeptide repeat protein [Myxococcaceae bacterium]